MFSYFGLKILLAILEKLPALDLSSVPVLENIGKVSNTFAWANYFLPVDVMVGLLGLTASFYIFKLFVRVFKTVRDFI